MLIPLHDSTQAMNCPQAVHKLLQQVLATESLEDRDKEHLWVFLLSSRNTIKTLHLVTLGTLTASLIHPREVFTRAVADRCVSIIIAHNHPSGCATPSHEDEIVTHKLVAAGDLLDIPVIDHVITAGDAFYSFKEHGDI